MKVHFLIGILSMGLSIPGSAQFDLNVDGAVPVSGPQGSFSMAWGGGLNYCQISDIDLDQDGLKDLFIFDRTGNKVVTLVNQGTPNAVDYAVTTEFDDVWPFPILHDWALLRDINCDGKEDILSYTQGGFAVYKNISDMNGPAFELVDTLVRSNYIPTDANLYVSQIDIPGIEDVDGDGDLDVLTFSQFGAYVEYHKNMSMETYGTCDSLLFEVRNRCWGFFSENLNNNSVTLNNPCNYNVPNPEMDPTDVLDMNVEQGVDALDAPTGTMRSAAHTGSTVLPLDLNGDGVKDLILGDVSYGTLAALYNGGTVTNALMISEDTLFPSYDASAQVQIFPGTFYEDINNDGKRDLLVSPNATSQSENFHSIWYYQNMGTDSDPVFELIQEDVLQHDMIDLGEGAYPVAFDHNRDGLMDLVVSNNSYYAPGGNNPGMMALLENTGTANSPEFTLITRDYSGLSTSGIGISMYPAFGDIDGDGDQDMYVGDDGGRLHYFENIATGMEAQFQLIMPNVTDVNGDPIDVGKNAAPQFFDVDGDGPLDLLIGERNGNVNFYRNSGSTSAPSWTLIRDSVGFRTTAEYWNNTGYSVPVMFMNQQNEREMLLGSSSGYIHRWTNIDGNLLGMFTVADTAFEGIKEGIHSALALHDWTGDGHLDVVTGNFRGGLGFWRNDFGVGIMDRNDPSSGPPLFVMIPNPAEGATELVLSLPLRSEGACTVMNALGQELMRMPLRTQRTVIPMEEFPSGLYLVQVSIGGINGVQRMIMR